MNLSSKRARWFGGILISFVFMFSLVCFSSAFDVGSFVDQGLASSGEAENVGAVYSQVMGDLEEAGISVEEFQADLEETATEVENEVAADVGDVGDEVSEEVFTRTLSKPKYTTLFKGFFSSDKGVSRKGSGLIATDYSKEKSFWESVLDFLGLGSTGKVVASWESEEIDLNDLPNLPSVPGEVDDVVSPHVGKMKLFQFLTGNAIVGVPEWGFNGEEGTGFIWKADYGVSLLGKEQFNLRLDSNYSREGAVNGIVYNKGYYLNATENSWAEFDFVGTRVGETDWLRNNGKATLLIDKVTEEDYMIFLTYSCLKIRNVENEDENYWDCNDGKWVVHVVETGETYYHGQAGGVPPVEYTVINDLNVTDIPSVLAQLGLTVASFQPVLHDAVVIKSNGIIESEAGQTVNLEFFVKNLGNRDLTGLKFELDVGEADLAEVVEADLPSEVLVGDTERGVITLKMGVLGGLWRFPLYLKDEQYEVDTSDNRIYFEVQVGDAVVRDRTDSLTEDWNREINYITREPFAEVGLEGAELTVISGTDKVRTVFGGYYQGRGINPTMKVYFQPALTEDALFSTPLVSTIAVGAKMYTGDREVVQYYVKITQGDKEYATPVLDSGFKYYFRPKDIIPDFQTCVDYEVQTYLVGETEETIDIIDADNFNLCNQKVLNPTANFMEKSDGYYVVLWPGLNEKYFSEMDVEYNVNLTSQKGYNYPVYGLSTADGPAMIKVEDVIGGSVDYNKGAKFNVSFEFVDNPVAREGVVADLSSGKAFSWRGWEFVLNSKTSLVLKKEKIRIVDGIKFSANSEISYDSETGETEAWKTSLSMTHSFYFPGYMDGSVVNSVLADSVFYLQIIDLNIEADGGDGLVYNFSSNACEISGCNFNGPGQHIKRISAKDWEKNVHGFPEFVQGHTYEFRLKILENAEKYKGLEPEKMLYIDGFQLIVKNPIFRTRFADMENAPFGFSSYSEGDSTVVLYSYKPKNVAVDLDNGKVMRADTEKREIKLGELWTFRDDLNNYIFDDGVSRHLFDAMSLKVVPLEDAAAGLELGGRAEFNCKIGRYDMRCYRDNSGYVVTYVDEGNSMLYQFALLDKTRRFLAKYRSNSEIYDFIVYDILSEINRNPVKDFGIPYTIEPTFGEGLPQLVFKLSQSNSPSLGKLGDCPKTFNSEFSELFGDFNLEATRIFSKADAYSLPTSMTVYLRRAVDDSEVGKIELDYSSDNVELNYLGEVCNLSEEKGNFGYLAGYKDERNGWYHDRNWIFQYRCERYVLADWFFGLDLEEGQDYYFDFDFGDNPGVVYFPEVFTYKKNYFDLVVNTYPEYVRQVEEVGAEVLGPFDASSCDYPELANSYFGREMMPDVGRLDAYLSRDLQLPGRFGRAGYLKIKFAEGSGTGEELTKEELMANVIGEERHNLASNRNYEFTVVDFDDVFEYYTYAPYKKNTYLVDEAKYVDLVCEKEINLIKGTDVAYLKLSCKWSDADDKLRLYILNFVETFPGLSVADVQNLDPVLENSFSNNFVNPVLDKYLEWFPSAPLVDTAFDKA